MDILPNELVNFVGFWRICALEFFFNRMFCSELHGDASEIVTGCQKKETCQNFKNYFFS